MKGMTPIVKTIARVVGAPIILFGIYIVVYGHLTPGGGFAGGVILALGIMLLMLAFGKEPALRKLPERRASFLDSLGALGFWAIALLGFAGGYYFLNFLSKGRPFHLVSAGTIPLSNISIGLKVSVSLFAVLAALSIYRRVYPSGEEPPEEED